MTGIHTVTSSVAAYVRVTSLEYCLGTLPVKLFEETSRCLFTSIVEQPTGNDKL